MSSFKNINFKVLTELDEGDKIETIELHSKIFSFCGTRTAPGVLS